MSKLNVPSQDILVVWIDKSILYCRVKYKERESYPPGPH